MTATFRVGSTMSVRVPALVLSLVALSPALAPAQQPDAEAAMPYLWRVVIQTRPHPTLTATFREQLRRDLLAALQPGLGPLGTVEVIDLDSLPRDRWDSLWQQFDDKGFAALEAPRDLTGVKTHFLRVEVKDGAFVLEARQHDGFTGLASPVLRRQVVRGPELAGRAAGLMIERDFGLAGTVEGPAGKDEVNVRFKAGQLGPLDRLVKVGDVFALSAVVRTNRPTQEPMRTKTGKVIDPPPGSTAPAALVPKARDFTLLRVVEVNPKDGVARCATLTQYKTPLPARTNDGQAVAGYRCLRLPTVTAPVSIRLASGDGSTPSIPIANVWAGDTGFIDKPQPRDLLGVPKDGVFTSARPLANVACVTVSIGPTLSKQFPVAILGPEPVTLRFEVDPKAEEKALFERAVLSVSARAADARTSQVATFEMVAKLIKEGKNADALARARSGFQATETTDKVLAEEVEQLKTQSAKSPQAGPLLNSVEQQLGSLRATNGQLGARIKDLEVVVQRSNDPSSVARVVQAEALNTRISLLLARGEVDEALAAYDQLATIAPENTEVKTRREKLATEWKLKDDEHAKARQYLVTTWPALATAQDLKESLPQLQRAVDVCKKANDKHAFRKFINVLGGLPTKLSEQVASLDPNSDGDRKALDDVKVVREQIAKLENELTEYLKANP